MGPRTGPSRGSAGRGGVQRQEAVGFVVAQAAEHGGEAAQGGLGADAAGVAEGNELGRDFDEEDVGDWLRLGHDGTPFRPNPEWARWRFRGASRAGASRFAQQLALTLTRRARCDTGTTTGHTPNTLPDAAFDLRRAHKPEASCAEMRQK